MMELPCSLIWPAKVSILLQYFYIVVNRLNKILNQRLVEIESIIFVAITAKIRLNKEEREQAAESNLSYICRFTLMMAWADIF